MACYLAYVFCIKLYIYGNHDRSSDKFLIISLLGYLLDEFFPVILLMFKRIQRRIKKCRVNIIAKKGEKFSFIDWEGYNNHGFTLICPNQKNNP